jgi:hypothetical protein
MGVGVGVGGRRLTRVERLEILDRVAGGETRPVVARAVGTTERTVGRVLQEGGWQAVSSFAA